MNGCTCYDITLQAPEIPERCIPVVLPRSPGWKVSISSYSNIFAAAKLLVERSERRVSDAPWISSSATDIQWSVVKRWVDRNSEVRFVNKKNIKWIVFNQESFIYPCAVSHLEWLGERLRRNICVSGGFF